MIILDTNVISEAMRTNPAEQVMRWVRFAPRDELYTTAISEAETRYGAARKSLHKKDGELERIVDRIYTVRFKGHVLSFDSAAATGTPVDPFEHATRPANVLEDGRLYRRNCTRARCHRGHEKYFRLRKNRRAAR